MVARKRALLVASSWLLLLILFHLSTVDADVPENSDFPTRPLWNETWTDKLKNDILRNYDKFSRPAQHTNATVVTVGLTVRHVEIDEMKSTMTVHGWVKMFWDDEKLRWNESDYGNITVLRLASHEIWQPDLVLYNSLTDIAEENYGHTHCVVYSSGSIVWVPPTRLVSICRLNLRHWPFDTQTCWIKLLSASYHGDHIDLQLDKEGAEIELLAPNTEWQLEKVSHHRNVRETAEEPRVDVLYYMTMKRRSATYSAVIVTPALVITLMTLAVFCLPPTSGEKVFLSGLTSITLCIFLISFAQRLPALQDHYSPLIVMFYSRSLYLVCLSLAVSIAVINLSRFQHLVAVPRTIKSCLAGSFGTWLGLGYGIVQVSVPRGSTSAGTNPVESQGAAVQRCSGSNQQDWVMVATAIDRIAFLAYCLLFAFLGVTCYV